MEYLYGMTIAQTQTGGLESLKYRLNLILIALLCSTTLAPCVLFFVRGEGQWIWALAFIAISYLVSRLPEAAYDQMQLSNNLNVYKALAVDQFKKLSTNGDWINRRIRRSYPYHRNVSDVESFKQKIRETYQTERAHTVLFTFCLLTTIYAFSTESITTGAILLAGNILFNFYPNLLQQYNRIRYRRAVERYS